MELLRGCAYSGIRPLVLTWTRNVSTQAVYCGKRSIENFWATRRRTIVTHDAPKLYDMWKDVNQKYVKALARYTQSGKPRLHVPPRVLERET